MQNDLRAELIKQLPSEVIETTDKDGNPFYCCPVCKKAIVVDQEKCTSCGQALSWQSIRKENQKRGIKKACLEFDVPSDFSLGDCRKCPLSYIGKRGDDNVYECPLQNRGACKLKIIGSEE